MKLYFESSKNEYWNYYATRDDVYHSVPSKELYFIEDEMDKLLSDYGINHNNDWRLTWSHNDRWYRIDSDNQVVIILESIKNEKYINEIQDAFKKAAKKYDSSCRFGTSRFFNDPIVIINWDKSQY